MQTSVAGETASTVRLGEAIAAQVAELDQLEQAVRLGEEPAAVHDMRVAVRRLRSILRTARPMLEPDWVDQLRSELEWLGDRLGRVRDLDVLSANLNAAAATLDGGDAVVAVGLLRPLRRERDVAQQELVAALFDERYSQLSAQLQAAGTSLPVTRADRSLEQLAAREFKRLRKRGKLETDLSNAALHKRRIRAKRARYAAELFDDGRRVRAFVKEAKRFQDLLGRHQDSVVARRTLRRLARLAGRADAGIVAGRLIQLESDARAEVRDAAPRAWKRLVAKGDNAWRSGS